MTEMRYVQRDQDGDVIGHFANCQPGYAEEELPLDHPDILAFQAMKEAQAQSVPARDFGGEIDALKKQNAALIAELAEKHGLDLTALDVKAAEKMEVI